MGNYYNLDGVKTYIKKEIDKDKALLAAWEAVTYPTKKDGKPFASMQKNLSGAKYTACQYAMQSGEHEITVHAWSELNGYVKDTVKAYDLVKYLDDVKKAKAQNYQEKQTYLEQVYTYDIDDIKEAIAKKIDYLEKSIDAMEKQLENANTAWTNFVNAFSAAVKNLESDCDKNTDCTMFYAIFETVKERYPYCK